METNMVSPMPEAPLAMMEKSPPRSPSIHDMPPPPDEKREDGGNRWGCGSWFEYIIIVILSSVLLIASIVSTLVWVIYYRDGYGWSDQPAKKFNFHPTLMVGGFITLSGFSTLLYRLCRCLKHIYVKLAHTFFHVCAVPCVVIAFLAVFDSKNSSDPPREHFRSLHSWLGLLTMGLFVLQFIVGFFSFLICLCCENATAKCRATMVPIHASFGLVTFMLACATCVTGLTKKENEGIIVNAIGIIIISLGIIISFAVRRSNSPQTARVCVTERL